MSPMTALQNVLGLKHERNSNVRGYILQCEHHFKFIIKSR